MSKEERVKNINDSHSKQVALMHYNELCDDSGVNSNIPRYNNEILDLMYNSAKEKIEQIYKDK